MCDDGVFIKGHCIIVMSLQSQSRWKNSIPTLSNKAHCILEFFLDHIVAERGLQRIDDSNGRDPVERTLDLQRHGFAMSMRIQSIRAGAVEKTAN